MTHMFESLRSKLCSLTQTPMFRKARSPKCKKYARRLSNETLEARCLLTTITHAAVVSENPSDTTPHVVLDGAQKMYALEQIGRTMYAGGKFSEVQDPVMTTTYARDNFFAFDADTGVISPLNLSFNGTVTGIEASADETALYISGSFSKINGITRRGIAKYDLVNNQIDPTFAPTGMQTVSDIRLVGGALIAAGNFDKHLMAMDLTTGADLGTIDITVSGAVDPTDETRVQRIAVSPDGTRLVATGNFTTVNGQPRKRAFMVDLSSTSTLSTWYAPRFEVDCNTSERPASAQGIDFSPDGSYFVIVATGGRGLTGICDAAARFETANVSSTVEPTWINWTGGDTLWSVVVTDPAVYVGGHQRWLDNTDGNNYPAPGAVERPGIGAIDPVTGLALPWNPTKSRNEGTRVLFATPDGLWVGSDGERFGNEDHYGIGFVPLDLSPTPDTTRPNTFIDSGPSGIVSGTSADFSFSASESSTFQCRLDGGAFTPCTSPVSYENVSVGSTHTFEVFAVDDWYNMDASPAELTWTVVAAGTELIGNPGFEVDTSGWKGDASSNTLTRVAGGHSSGWAAELSNTVAGTLGIDDNPNWVTTTDEGSYTASLWARSDTPGLTLKLRLREYAGGSKVGTSTETMELTSSWQQLTAHYTPVAPGSFLDFEAYTTDAPVGASFRFDDASITLDLPPGVRITESSNTTNVTEGGAVDSYTVVLDSIPTADVNVTITPDSQTDLGSGAGTAIMLTFTPADARTPQVVNIAAVDDVLPEGPHVSTITHAATSADTDYNGMTINNVVANVTDNDTAGVTIIESGGTTDVSEGSIVDSYTVVLDLAPTDNVDVTVTPDGQADLGAGPGTAIVLTFTPATALLPQIVNVTAVDDAIDEGQHTSTITHAATSTDLSYNGLTINQVVANVIDNDTAGVTIVESDGTTDVTEGSVADSYTIVLDSEPTADVSVTVTPDNQSDLGAGAGTAIVLTFTPTNALIPQSVNVTAVDDTDVELPHISTIIHGATSADANYDGISMNDVVANITDNDTAGQAILYLSFRSPTDLPGALTVKDEDIVGFDGSAFSLFFDGSDVDIGATDVDALAVISSNEILLSFTGEETIPGIAGTVKDSDIVKFTATQLGETTSGTFEMFFRGSDVGLSESAEDIDALDLLDDGRLIISTTGSFAVTGVSGKDEDLIAFTPATPGDYSSGTWAMYFEGSDVELGGEDLNGTAIDANGNVLLSTTSAFSVTGVLGSNDDIFSFAPTQLGTNTTGTYDTELQFDGSQFGLSANDVDAFDIPVPAALHGAIDVGAASPSRIGEAGLTQEAVESMVSASMTLWASALDAPLFLDVRVQVADLPGGIIGTAQNGLITVDANANGVGWFIDATPLENSEFEEGLETTSLLAAAGSDAAGRYDLLTLVAHEMGHLLGFHHSDHDHDSDHDHLMASILPLGVRRLPSPLNVDNLASALDESNRSTAFVGDDSPNRTDRINEMNRPAVFRGLSKSPAIVDLIFDDLDRRVVPARSSNYENRISRIDDYTKTFPNHGDKKRIDDLYEKLGNSLTKIDASLRD